MSASPTRAAPNSSASLPPATRTVKSRQRGTPKRSSVRSTPTPTRTSPSNTSNVSDGISKTTRARQRSSRWVAPSSDGKTRSPPGTKPTSRTDPPKQPTTSSNGSNGSRSGSDDSATTESGHSSTPEDPTGTCSPPSHPAEIRSAPFPFPQRDVAGLVFSSPSRAVSYTHLT